MKNDDDDNHDESHESDAWWVYLKRFWIKRVADKYSMFQQQQQLLNFLFLYHETWKRFVNISTKNLVMSLFFTGISQRHASMDKKIFMGHATGITLLYNMDALCKMGLCCVTWMHYNSILIQYGCFCCKSCRIKDYSLAQHTIITHNPHWFS